jgi:hypothetical protein
MLRFVSCAPNCQPAHQSSYGIGGRTSVGCATCNGTCLCAMFATNQLLLTGAREQRYRKERKNQAQMHNSRGAQGEMRDGCRRRGEGEFGD